MDSSQGQQESLISVPDTVGREGEGEGEGGRERGRGREGVTDMCTHEQNTHRLTNGVTQYTNLIMEGTTTPYIHQIICHIHCSQH